MKFKLCLTLFLITLAVSCLVIIIILVPILVLPSLSDKKVDYNPVPVTCQLRDNELVTGWKKCRVWHSCRQDCHLQQLRQCRRLYVAYHMGHINDSQLNSNQEQEMQKDVAKEGIHEEENGTLWIQTFIPLLINPESCGEPPQVDCDDFHTRFKIGQKFPCYHSRTHPTLAVLQYSWNDDVYPVFLTLSLLGSLCIVFCISCFILCFWHCRASSGYDSHKVDIETVRKYAFE